MSKYETGKYVLTLFNERGMKVNVITLDNEGLIDAQRYGYDMIRKGECHSFNIHRNVFNSMDPKGPW